MDFDSFITFLFILLFFILPSILKQVQARKKKKTVTKPVTKLKKKRSSFLGQISDQIQKFLQDLEAQARQQKKAIKEHETARESLSEDKILHSDMEKVEKDTDEKIKEREVSRKRIEREVSSQKLRKQYFSSDDSTPGVEKSGLLSDSYQFRSDPLQNAVIWSEILSRPLALREEDNSGI